MSHLLCRQKVGCVRSVIRNLNKHSVFPEPWCVSVHVGVNVSHKRQSIGLYLHFQSNLFKNSQQYKNKQSMAFFWGGVMTLRRAQSRSIPRVLGHVQTHLVTLASFFVGHCNIYFSCCPGTVEIVFRCICVYTCIFLDYFFYHFSMSARLQRYRKAFVPRASLK